MTADRAARRALSLVAVVVLLQACSSGPSLSPVAGGMKADVLLLGAGFCEFEGHRIPIEQFILTMRMRLRGGGEKVRDATLVRIRMDPSVSAAARADLDFVLDELTAMGVGQIRYL